MPGGRREFGPSPAGESEARGAKPVGVREYFRDTSRVMKNEFFITLLGIDIFR